MLFFMHSMTGFGRARKTGLAGSVEAQISCVNKRGVEISVACPKELSSLEGALHELLKTAFERGKLQLTLRVETKKTSSAIAVGQRVAELKKLCRSLKIDFAPDARLMNDLLKETSSAPADAAALETLALEASALAIDKCRQAQAQEGERLKKDFTARLQNLAALREEVLPLAGKTVALQRERLLKNLTQAGLITSPSDERFLNDERLLKELSLFADRVDITEELTRIASHLTAAQKMISPEKLSSKSSSQKPAGKSSSNKIISSNKNSAADKSTDKISSDKGASLPPSIGRSLEFLLQELLREWNTLGNKSTQIELVQIALAAKNEIERMREQAANVV